MFQDMLAMSNNGGGVTLNPTAAKYGTVAPNGSVSQQLDLTKSYMLTISTNANASVNYNAIFFIDKGETSVIYKGDITQDISVSNAGILSFTNLSGSYYRSYCLTQLD